MKKILHLCADIGSDSYFYQIDPEYEVILVGENIGVENYNPPHDIYGVIANPVCTDFSTAKNKNLEKIPDLTILKNCLRIILEAKPVFWVVENPATGLMSKFLGQPEMIYQPWEFGSPYTKKTALWGKFKRPEKIYEKWEDVPKNNNLYTRPNRKKPSLAFLHKSAIEFLPEFHKFKDKIKNDADFRSLCSQGFAEQFYLSNR